MINFSKISNKSFFGKFLRFFLAFIPSSVVVRILQGRLKGKKWIKGSGVNGYWLGSYEKNQRENFEKILKRGDIVFDIGANVGFYSLLAAELVGPAGKVFSFEPLPENFNYLQKHIEINGYKNIFPFQAAVSEKNGFAFFGGIVNRSQGKLTENGEFKVKIISIDDWVDSGKLPKSDVLKIDVEGAEYQTLKGMETALKKYRPKIFLSTHGPEIHKKCCDFLYNLGYKLKSLSEIEIEKSDNIIAY